MSQSSQMFCKVRYMIANGRFANVVQAGVFQQTLVATLVDRTH